jgi:hypothetical protein
MVDRMHQAEKRNCAYCNEVFIAESILQKVCNKCYLKNRGTKRKNKSDNKLDAKK